jgi:protein-disulfide isomerase
MNTPWKIALAGMIGGAALALVMVFGAAAFGLLPQKSVLDGNQLHAYLLAHPDLILEMQVQLQQNDDDAAQREQQAAAHKIGEKAFFDPRIAFVSGPADARIKFVELFDYNCPYCRASLPAVKKFYNAHKRDTRFSFIEFPIKGPNSVVAARASLAARKQPDKYLAFHFALMNEDGPVTEKTVFADAAKVGLDVAKLKADMADPTVNQAIDLAHKLATRAKIDGTPTFLINGHLRPGAVEDKDLNDMAKAKPI